MGRIAMRTVIASLHIIAFALPMHAADAPARHEFREVHMGTEWRIVLYAPDKPAAEKAGKAAFARIAELEMAMSDYNPKSELMRACLKNDAEPGVSIPLSDDLWDVLQVGTPVVIEP